MGGGTHVGAVTVPVQQVKVYWAVALQVVVDIVVPVPEQDKDDMDAMGDELDSSQWVNMITTLGLKPESDTKTTEIERLRSMFKK